MTAAQGMTPEPWRPAGRCLRLRGASSLLMIHHGNSKEAND